MSLLAQEDTQTCLSLCFSGVRRHTHTLGVEVKVGKRGGAGGRPG